MNAAAELFNAAELSMAAYAQFASVTATHVQRQRLVSVGMSEYQATEFATRYPEILAVKPRRLARFQRLFGHGAQRVLTGS
ncbi:MAG: hypothetical protein IPI75_12800 [Gammaproteobacteria bacterium]|nr:hypothetical protein [Gammaproteobacteria bacterium]